MAGLGKYAVMRLIAVLIRQAIYALATLQCQSDEPLRSDMPPILPGPRGCLAPDRLRLDVQATSRYAGAEQRWTDSSVMYISIGNSRWVSQQCLFHDFALRSPVCLPFCWPVPLSGPLQISVYVSLFHVHDNVLLANHNVL